MGQPSNQSGTFSSEYSPINPSYKSKAKYLYANRVQLENEELSCYHGLLLSLRNNAFDNTDRSESALIEKFVAGIKNEKTHAAVHTQIAAGNAPSNYNEALEMSVQSLLFQLPTFGSTQKLFCLNSWV